MTAGYEIGSKNCKFERPGMHWVCSFIILALFYWQTARQVQNIDANPRGSLTHGGWRSERHGMHSYTSPKRLSLTSSTGYETMSCLCRLFITCWLLFSGFCLLYCIACCVYLHSLQVMFLFVFCSFCSCSAMLPSL